MRGVRTAVALARTKGRHDADRPRLDHLVHPDRLGVEHDVLEIGVEHAGVRDELEHLASLGGVPAEGLRASDGLAVPGRGADGLDMEMVRERHDDEVDLRIGADGLDRVEGPAAETRGEGLASLGSCAPVRHHACVGDVAETERVELPDEPGAEHPDPDGHQYPPSPAATMVGARPALRARKSSMIVLVAVAPTRVTPRFMTSIRASRVRTPPAALTWM